MRLGLIWLPTWTVCDGPRQDRPRARERAEERRREPWASPPARRPAHAPDPHASAVTARPDRRPGPQQKVWRNLTTAAGSKRSSGGRRHQLRPVMELCAASARTRPAPTCLPGRRQAARARQLRWALSRSVRPECLPGRRAAACSSIRSPRSARSASVSISRQGWPRTDGPAQVAARQRQATALVWPRSSCGARERVHGPTRSCVATCPSSAHSDTSPSGSGSWCNNAMTNSTHRRSPPSFTQRSYLRVTEPRISSSLSPN